MIIFHHNDADGRCSAAIVELWLNNEKQQNNTQALKERLEFVEMDYNKIVPIDKIQRDDTVVIVDFSFKPEDMKMAQLATDIGTIWCDHHITAKDYGYNVAGVRDFTNKGMAGCECTWKFFFPNKTIPNWVRILGDYDAWRMQEKDLCLPFYEGLKLENQRPNTNNVWHQLLNDETQMVYNEILHNGKTAIKYRDNYCEEIKQAFGYETIIDGHKAYAMNLYRFGSKAFGNMLLQYPICILYIYDGNKFTVSLYSEIVDVSIIAKKLGGGGHKGAAGFICEVLPFGKVN
jgi:uncharacterized protein